MPLSVISISSDSFEESVGSSTTQVILFGTIPTVIPADVSTTVPAVLEMAAVVFASPAEVLDLDTHPTSETGPYSSERPSSPDSYEVTIARWRSKVALRSSSSSSAFTPPAPVRLYRHYVIYLADLLLLFYLRRRVSPYSSSSATHSSSPVSAGPSHKRSRSPTTYSPFIRADLFPPRKRLRDPSSAYYHEVSVEVGTEIDIEDNIETGAEGDIERDIEVVAAIETDTAADTIVAVETDVESVEAGSEPVEAEVDAKPSAGDTVEIAVDVVAEPVVPDDLPVATIEEQLDDIEEEQRAQETRAVTADTKRARLLDRIRVLEGSNIGLRDALGVERERGLLVTMTITRFEMTPKAIEELINQRVAEALAAQEANHNVRPVVGSENQYGDE
ncbi:hypothetical protein Tco_1085546 [Tanacetum coccineum]